MPIKKFVMLAALLMPLLTSAAPAQTPAAAPRAPELSFKDLQGISHTTSSMKGKVWVLNYWFPNCPPCVAEIPDLNKIVDTAGLGKAHFMAPAFAERDEVTAFLQSHPLKYMVAFADGDSAMQLYPSKAIVFPLHVVIGHDGAIVYRKAGNVNVKELTAAIQSALKSAGTR